MSDHLLCCFYFNRDSSQQQHNRKFTIRNIDKSMIGLPTNFQHCAHIGCSDIISNALPITNAFDSKYPEKSVISRQQTGPQQPLVSHLKLIDLNVS